MSNKPYPLERIELADLHRDLFEAGLVVSTGGNISSRVNDGFLIKPSGVAYRDLTPESMILCTLDGDVIEGDFNPSSDTAAHAYVYRNMPDVGGVVHTHSNYACAFAAASESIPCVLTAIADEFGGEIPLAPFAIIGDDSIGQGIVATLSGHRSRAVIMDKHGVFTIGDSPASALKSAVMCEDNAKSVWLGRQLRPLEAIPQPHVDSLFYRYQNVYGQ